MKYIEAQNLLGLKQKRELASILLMSEGAVSSANPDAQLSKKSEKLITLTKEVIDLENILNTLGYGVARNCDDCGKKFETLQLREDGDNNVVCDNCLVSYINGGDRVLIDGSWFDDNIQRGYIVDGSEPNVFIMHSDEKIYLKDIPLSKITIFDGNQFLESSTGIFN